MDNQGKKVNFEMNPNLNQLSGPVSWTEFQGLFGPQVEINQLHSSRTRCFLFFWI
jgi:hypothetical protein